MRDRLASWDRRWPGVVWIVLALAHVWPVALAIGWGWNAGLSDPGIYQSWLSEARQTKVWPLLDASWVYPPAALVIMLPLLAVADQSAAVFGWVALSFVLNVFVVGRLLEQPRGRQGAWWWVAFLLFCGAVAVARLETITAPLTVLALIAWCRGHTSTASAVVTVAGWIKLAPFVWLVPMLVSRVRTCTTVLVSSAVTSAVVVVPFIVLGGASHVLSFLTYQADRGLQMESPWALGIQVGRLFGSDARPVYDEGLETFQFEGGGADLLASAADVTLPLLVLGILALAIRASWLGRGAIDSHVDGFVATGTALTCALILGNKVGSPQFSLWLAPGIVMLLVAGVDRVRAHRWAVLGLLMGVATQIEYPLRLNSAEADALGVVALALRYAVVGYLFVSSIRVLAYLPAVRQRGSRRTGTRSWRRRR